MKRQAKKVGANASLFAVICIVFTLVHANVFGSWKESGSFFKLQSVKGKKVFVDPDGKPFYSLAMVYAFGPESPDFRKELTPDDVLAELEKMKAYGFNTLNLYGETHLDHILQWCEANNMAYYPRTSYSGDEFPDFMDSEYRDKAKHSYDKYLEKIKNFKCVLAIDMDLRWMYRDSDWSGKKHPSVPGLGKATVSYFPKWLKAKYSRVGQLNRKWKKTYGSFEDVLTDREVIDNGAFVKLGMAPWRNDVFEYNFWVINDFLKDLTSYMRSIDPNHLITYTTELPEVFEFPISTPENSGIDFASPVHYNADFDYGRDWISLCKLILQGKFHSDLNGTPAYISESGWRTSPLQQKPPVTSYAMAKPGNERHLAELYVRQNAAVAALPFMTGWSYFKWYDKWFEGDFGFIRDNGSDKPMSAIGKVMNPLLQVNSEGEAPPQVYVYYPPYNFSSPRASFGQHKSLVAYLEYDFISQFNAYCDTVISKYMDNPAPAMKGEKLFTDLVPLFKRAWLPFNFITGLPNDGKPVLLAGGALEQISASDRKALDGMKTITFGEAGKYNERFENVNPWYLEAVGIKAKMFETQMIQVDISGLLGNGGYDKAECLEKDCEFRVREENGQLKYAECAGQEIKFARESFTKLQFLAASVDVNASDKIILRYSDGSSKEEYLGATVPPMTERPAFGHLGMEAMVDGKKAYLTHLADIPVDPMKKLVAVVLPKQPLIRVFAVSANSFGVVHNCSVAVDFNGIKMSGSTPWMLYIRPDTKAEYKVLAKFENGSPAIVQSKDGKHIAYLYDPLTWEGGNTEICADWKNNSAALKQLIKELK